jgi:hypothetical protein
VADGPLAGSGQTMVWVDQNRARVSNTAACFYRLRIVP